MKERFLFRPPTNALSSAVLGYWFAEGDPNTILETVLPNGVIEFILNIGSSEHLAHDPICPGRIGIYRAAWFAGFQEGPLVIMSRGETRLYGIRFRPGGALPLLGKLIPDLSNKVVETGDLPGYDTNMLREILAELPSPEQGFSILEAYLFTVCGHSENNRSRFSGPWDGMVEAAVRMLAGERRPVSEIAEELGLSHAHFIRRFRESTGTSPKTLRAIYRFQRAISLLNRKSDGDFSRVYQDAGYYDQAHFNHEFKRLSNLTPGEYLHFRSADPNHVYRQQ